MSLTTHPVLNRDREEIRISSPQGSVLLNYLNRRGFQGRIRTDLAGDVIALEGEPEMCRVVSVIADWEKQADHTSA
jgi:hypothetical protein